MAIDLSSFRKALASSDRGTRRSEAASPAEVDGLSFRDLIRLGAEKALIDDPTAWFGFREGRNASLRTYDDAKAREVYSVALAFAPAARRLMDRLAARGE